MEHLQGESPSKGELVRGRFLKEYLIRGRAPERDSFLEGDPLLEGEPLKGEPLVRRVP